MGKVGPQKKEQGWVKGYR